MSALFVISTHLAAQTTAYVSTGAGNQILTIANADGVNGSPAVSVLCTGDSTFVPEDVVVGPDGLLYIADTTFNRIWRLDPGNPPSSCNLAEKIYDANGATGCTDPSSGILPAPSISCPSAPEGPSFVSEPNSTSTGSLDMVFNTHGPSATGVWKMQGIASLPSGCSAALTCTLPKPARVIQPFTTAGEGIEFDILGNMLMVDQANGKVFRKTPPFSGTASAFISSLSSPFGIAVNACGDILVASGTNVNRYNATTGAAFSDHLSFSNTDKPKFLEVDSGNRLYVVTASKESGQGGKVWRINPASSTNPISSCTLPSGPPPAPIADLGGLKKTVAGLDSGNALGLGVSATNFTSQVQCFTASGAANGKLYNFGHHTIFLSCDNLIQPFCMKVTALKSRPTNGSQPEVAFTLPFSCPSSATGTFTVPNPVCMHYGSQHGFCTQYVEQTCTAPSCATPVPDTNVCSSFTFKIGFFSDDLVDLPGAAHVEVPGEESVPPQTIAANPYNQCVTQDFYTAPGPGLDYAARGTNSKHVVFNSDLAFNGVITLNSPVSSCGIASLTCNPQFNFGQNISTKFTLTDAVSGAAITQATERLSILRIQHTTNGTITNEFVPQTVVSTNNSSFENFFNANSSGMYSFGVDSSAFDPLPKGTSAVYQFTIWGNGAAPFSFNILVQF